MKKTSFIKATLAVAMAVFSSTAAMGQSKSDKKDIDWMKEITSRVTLNGLYGVCSCIVASAYHPS